MESIVTQVDDESTNAFAKLSPSTVSKFPIFASICVASSPSAATTASTALAIAPFPQPDPKRGCGKQKKPFKSNKLSNRDKCKRYREKRKNYLVQLTDDTHRLREEVIRLCQRQNALMLQSMAPVTPSASSVEPLLLFAHEYYRLFEFGMSKAHAPSCKSITRAQQLEFLKSEMVEDLHFGELRGIDALVEQWSTYGDYHTALCFELENLQLSGSQKAPIIQANTNLHVRFSRHTIEKVFPHALANEALVQKLIGRVVTYPSKNEFQFVVDDATGKWMVSRYDVQAAFVPAFLKALDSLDDVIALMQDAKIVNDHIIGEQAQASLRSAERCTTAGSRIEELVDEEDKMSLDFITT